MNVILIIILIIKALKHAYFIEGRKRVNYFYDRMWHIVDVVLSSTVIISLGFIYCAAWEEIVFLWFMFHALQSVVFNLSLNLFRNLMGADIGLFHLGTAGIEGWFTKRKIGYLYWIFAVILNICITFIGVKCFNYELWMI